MKKQDVEKITTEYLKPVFGFALKRCHSEEDAEDLSQDIMLKLYVSLLKRDDIEDVSKFIWTVAHNCLSNYYRNKKRRFTEELNELCEIADDKNKDPSDDLINKESIKNLQNEIAYLSKLQRRIVIAYYYENKKQEEIAVELNIPVGTVKWHLFEAKKELKRGMETMRKAGELKFNPIRFESYNSLNASGNEDGVSNHLRSLLSQNIIYSVRREAKTIKEIATELGVSPVYVESEAENLEKNGFLLLQKDKYISNILINEPTDELNRLHDEMYMSAAKFFANDVYDKLVDSGILDSEHIVGGFNEELTMSSPFVRDKNFILWSLIPYIVSESGKGFVNGDIEFSEVSTIRPDGCEDICSAFVTSDNVKAPLYNEGMEAFKGPYSTNLSKNIWTISTEWNSNKRISQVSIIREAFFVNIYLNEGSLSDEKYYAMLAKAGYISVCGNPDQLFKTALRVVYINNEATRLKLLSIGNELKEKYKAEFEKLKQPYIEASLRNTPKHLHKMRLYTLQNLFSEDKWFIIHCLKELVNNGKLKEPTENQRLPLSTLIFNKPE